ncbi:hypothetical protein KW786_03800, partial [Candidatus Parcubacteria bacterium]|nr:hypothetical protein [Candidatus Parcubacteria bacterium]
MIRPSPRLSEEKPVDDDVFWAALEENLNVSPRIVRGKLQVTILGDVYTFSGWTFPTVTVERCGIP